MESKTFTLELPASGGNVPIKLECEQSVVIIGANGAGKTRLGTWVEFQSKDRNRVHRISAQKSLTMPEAVNSSNLESAQSNLLFGNPDAMKNFNAGVVTVRIGNKWSDKPNTGLLNDFQKLMVFLFSEEASVSISYRRNQIISPSLSPIPETYLDVVKRIWESILPHRELLIGGGKIETQVKNSGLPRYNGAEMSDGERVAFYLIGQALSAPQNGIIIIDEPELHLHKSIQTRLWREIQAARPDCLFVYMTHDVEFAASLTEAKKIWLKSYDGAVWEWKEVPAVEEFPEALLLQILGTRQPVLFVEGDEGSYDVELFRVLYPNHLVIPRKGCEQVILATRALREASQHIHKEAVGIIDRDRRHADEISNLEKYGVKVLDVAEVENLFCVPEVLRWVAQHQGFSPDMKENEARQRVFKKLSDEMEMQISSHVAEEIKWKLNVFDIKKRGATELQAELEARTQAIDVGSIYRERETEFRNVLANQDYLSALKIFNHKGLATGLSGLFGVTKLPETVIRLANSGKQQELRQALQNHIPQF